MTPREMRRECDKAINALLAAEMESSEREKVIKPILAIRKETEDLEPERKEIHVIWRKRSAE